MRRPALNYRHPLLSLRGLPEIVAASGISVRLWRAYAQAWLVCLLFPILFLVQTPLTAVHLLITLAGLAIFVPLVLLVRGLGVDMIGVARLASARRCAKYARPLPDTAASPHFVVKLPLQQAGTEQEQGS